MYTLTQIEDEHHTYLRATLLMGKSTEAIPQVPPFIHTTKSTYLEVRVSPVISTIVLSQKPAGRRSGDPELPGAHDRGGDRPPVVERSVDHLKRKGQGVM